MANTITITSAKEVLAGWDGMIEVSVQKIGDAGADGNAYTDIEEAVADFNACIHQYESYKFATYMISFSKTWPDDPDDEYSSWRTEFVFGAVV